MSSIGGNFERGRAGETEPFSEAMESEAAAVEADAGARAGQAAVIRGPVLASPLKAYERAAIEEDARRYPELAGGGRQTRVVDAKKAGGGFEVTLASFQRPASGAPRPGLSAELGGTRRSYLVTGDDVALLKGPRVNETTQALPRPALPPALGLKAIDTEDVAQISVGAPDRLSVGAGIGAGFTCSGGEFGVEIEGRRIVVETEAGDDGLEKIAELKTRIEAAGYAVAETRYPAIDTFNAEWKITKAGGGSTSPAAPRQAGRSSS